MGLNSSGSGPSASCLVPHLSCASGLRPSAVAPCPASLQPGSAPAQGRRGRFGTAAAAPTPGPSRRRGAPWAVRRAWPRGPWPRPSSAPPGAPAAEGGVPGAPGAPRHGPLVPPALACPRSPRRSRGPGRRLPRSSLPGPLTYSLRPSATSRPALGARRRPAPPLHPSPSSKTSPPDLRRPSGPPKAPCP